MSIWGDVGKQTTGPVALGTTITDIYGTVALPVGNYWVHAMGSVVNVGAPTQTTVTPAFTGTATPICYSCIRYTASTIVASTHQAFAIATGTAASCIMFEIRGLFTVTVAGNFTVGGTRTGGTSQTVQPGAFLELKQVG